MRSFLAFDPVEGTVRIDESDIIKSIEYKLINLYSHMLGSVRSLPIYKGEYFEDDLFCYECTTNQKAVNVNVVTQDFLVGDNLIPYQDGCCIMYETDEAYQNSCSLAKIQNHEHTMEHYHDVDHNHNLSHFHSDITSGESKYLKKYRSFNIRGMFYKPNTNDTQLFDFQYGHSGAGPKEICTSESTNPNSSTSFGNDYGPGYSLKGYPFNDTSYLYSSVNDTSNGLPPALIVYNYIITKIKIPYEIINA